MSITRLANGYVVLSTGRRVRCHNDTIGLRIGDREKTDGSWDRMTWGYDAIIHTERDAREFGEDDPGPAAPLTDDECRELADFMIAAWVAYRATLDKP